MHINVAARYCRHLGLGLLLGGLFLGISIPGGDASAARRTDIYTAEVDMPESGDQLRAAFDRALVAVMVKVTGLPSAGTEAARASLFPNSRSLVQQYSVQPGNRVKVEFDGVAVQRKLDAAGQPVWGADRPLVAVWLAVDQGNGSRYILSANAAGSSAQEDAVLDNIRVSLSLASDERGLPIVIPLVDAEDLSKVSFTDVWGDFRNPVVAASARYGADAVLLGRARSLSPQDARVRWTLAAGQYQVNWEGSVADGPRRAAEYIAQRFATYAGSSGVVRLLVTNIGSLSQYGQIQNHLRTLSVVDDASVVRVNADRVEFDLVVRGDAARLGQSLDASRLLTRSSFATSGMPGAGRKPDLIYSWAATP